VRAHPVWRQKNQRGLLMLFTVKLHCGICVALAGTFWKFESMPATGVVLRFFVLETNRADAAEGVHDFTGIREC
jgi:hypothetical protein